MIPSFLTSCMTHELALLHQKEMAALRQRRSDLKQQVRDAAKEERNLAKKRQRLMQAGEPGAKGKLSISVANDFGRPPRIWLVTCSSCCSVPTSKALMVDLCSDVLRIMDLERMRLCMHLLVVAKCDVIPRLETFQALNDTGTLFLRNFAGLGQRAGADAGKERISGSCRPYVSKRQSGIERIRLLEMMLNRCFRKHFGA